MRNRWARKKFYEKKNLIGKGQYGKVYKVINKKTKEIRAIKIMYIDED
jgi:serine/threonine protein kinase